MSASQTFPATYLRELTQRILETADTPPEIAVRVAQILVNANLAGHDSHGILRIPMYLDQIEKQVLVPDARSTTLRQAASTALVDACCGWGHCSAWQAMELAMEKATETGIGAIAISRCNHIGRLGEYAEQAAARGFASLVTIGLTGPGIGGAAPFGGTGRLMGTNPWAFGIPTDGEFPIVADFATTVVAEGKIHVAQSKAAPLAPGCILDKDGHPSTDPADYYAGGTILHAAGHKGYGLGLIACLLGGLAADVEPWLRHFNIDDPGWTMGGVFLVALEIRRFRELAGYKTAVADVVAGLKSSPTVPGVSEVLVPGELEHRTREKREENGIEIPESIWNELKQAAGKLGVEV